MKQTQREKIIDYINENGSITSYEACMRLGITQFATRVSELKEQGYNFETEWIKGKNRDRHVVYFKKYMLAKVGEAV